MTDAPHTAPPDAADEIPADFPDIARIIDDFSRCAATPDFKARRDALRARLEIGARVTEEDRAAALELPWPVYALIRGCSLALAADAAIHLDDDNGAPMLWIERVAGVYEFRRADNRLLGAIAAEYVDAIAVSLVAGPPAYVH